MNEIRHAIGGVQQTIDLPDIEEAVPAGVERIVVQSSGQLPKIDQTAARELHLFGNYRTRSFEQEQTASVVKAE